MQNVYDVAIVGGGIAGFSAALTAKNLKLNALWLGEEPFGKKVRAAEYVRNYPAFTGNGGEFLARLTAQMEHEEVAFTQARIDGVYKQKGDFLLTQNGNLYAAKAVILCTGVQLNGNVKGEDTFLGRGVSYCAVCDGALYRGREIAVVVSEERYAHEVEYLAGFALKVHAFCLYKGAKFEKENITVHTGAPLRIEGQNRVEKIVTESEVIPVSGVFILRGATPPAALVGGLVTDGAHVKVARDLSTNIAGLFAAGDVTGTPYQYAKAAGEGLVAAYSVRAYLSDRE